MDNRCNRRDDCGDNSDEEGCSTVAISSNYLKQHPPLAKEGPIAVTMVIWSACITLTASQDLTIFNLLDISENKGTLNVVFGLQLTWLDPRLDFHNLKVEDELNILSYEEQTNIWVPVLTFANTPQR